jgi:hypothetical protein
MESFNAHTEQSLIHPTEIPGIQSLNPDLV